MLMSAAQVVWGPKRRSRNVCSHAAIGAKQTRAPISLLSLHARWRIDHNASFTRSIDLDALNPSMGQVYFHIATASIIANALAN